MSSAARSARHFGNVTARDIQNRAHGALARAHVMGESAAVSDRILVARVRAKLGRYVSHPKAIAVTAHRGTVDLSGDILEGEYATALKAASAVRGVKAIEDRLQLHRAAGSVPSLQGGKAPAGEPSELEQHTWTPALRLANGMLGLGLLVVGALILARSVANRPLAELADRPLDAHEPAFEPSPEPGAWSIEES